MNEEQLFLPTIELQDNQIPQPMLVSEVTFRTEPAVSSEEHAAYPAPERDTPDWRRLEVAAARFGDRIAAGLRHAAENSTGIGRETARTIAHVLGRAYGRMSALSGYGRLGEGDYEQLRDEYLALAAATDSGWVKDLVDTYGSHLIREKFPDAHAMTYMGRDFAKLEQLLVPTEIEIGERKYVVHVPGNYGREAIEDLTITLAELQIDQDTAFSAYLALPDVNAMSGDIMQDFHDNYVGIYPSIEDAIHELSGVTDRIDEVHEYAEERHLAIDAVSPDYEALGEETANGYDIVEREGRAYAFYK